MLRHLCLVLGFVLALPGTARAYTIDSVITKPCHERLTMSALRTVRADLSTAGRIDTPTRDDSALVNDLPFSIDDDLKELAAATLLIGVRDNDLKGRGAAELDHLAEVHGNPEDQNNHCLRARDEDEPDGTARAVEDCRNYIRGRVADALDGLDAAGAPDASRRTTVRVVLGLRGGVDAELPRYWASMGQAMHAVQDSFAHSFRSTDRLRIRSSLNWIDWIEGTQTDERDGPAHRDGLDECENLDELRQRNFDVAREASVALLRATLDPALDRAGKNAAVEAMLAKYLSVEPGCTSANAFCDSPDRTYNIAGGCAHVVGTRSMLAALLVTGAAALLVARRRRMASLALGMLVLFPARAEAQEEPAPVVAPAPDPQNGSALTAAPPGLPTQSEVKDEHIERKRAQKTWGAYAGISGSVTNPAFSGHLGVRLRLSEMWEIGLDGELNNWFAIHTSALRTGAFNGYFTGILRYPLRFEAINLRTTANLGTSVLLIDLYGAPSGSVGIYAGIAPLGLEWKMNEHAYLVFDPLGVALPVPNLKGVPFAYVQYRSSVGIELAF